MPLTFQPRYGVLALCLLAVEIAIARYIPTGLIRSFVGDVLFLIGGTLRRIPSVMVCRYGKSAQIMPIKVTNNTTFALLINAKGSNIVALALLNTKIIL
jgi:hypothetical protein